MTDIIARAQERFTETTIDDEIVVMSLEDGDFFSLTGSSREIWQLIDGTRSRDAIIAALVAGYGEDAAEIGADVDLFLAQLRDAGLVTG